MPIRPACAADADAIAHIYNQGIEDRAATFETTLRSREDMLARLEGSERYPLLVIQDEQGAVVGWAGLSRYRPRACYDAIADFSIYLERGVRGQGLGRALLQALIAQAQAQGFAKLVSRVFACNHGSRALCRACGFREVGVYERHGCLDGRWIDCVIVERLLAVDPEARKGRA